MPQGLILLGKIGWILYSSTSEIIAFISMFIFLVYVFWSLQKGINLNEIDLGMDNTNLIGLILSFAIYDAYVKTYYSRMNFASIKILPYSFL